MKQRCAAVNIFLLFNKGCTEYHCLDFNSMTGEIAHLFTIAGIALWVTTWFSGKGKYLEAEDLMREAIKCLPIRRGMAL